MLYPFSLSFTIYYYNYYSVIVYRRPPPSVLNISVQRYTLNICTITLILLRLWINLKSVFVGRQHIIIVTYIYR